MKIILLRKNEISQSDSNVAPTGVVTYIPDGIYRCALETVAVNSADNAARETVYVGVYGSGGT